MRSSKVFDSDFYFKWQYLTFFCLTIFLLIALSLIVRSFIDGHCFLQVDHIDIAIIIYVLYLTVHSIFRDVIYVDKISPIVFSLLAITFLKQYFLSFLQNQKLLTIAGILWIFTILAACGQGILQLFEYSPSLNSNFQITGPFNNPGPFGIWLSLNLPIAVAGFLSSTKILRKSIFAFCVILSIILMALMQSRTSWICSLPTIVVIFLYLPDRIRSFTRKRYFLIFLLALGLIATAYLSFSFKRESSIGRFFIWRNSIQLIQKEPIFGYGPNTFEREYGYSRSRHFQTNAAGGDETYSSGKIDFAFNEYIQMLIELGSVGLLLFFIIIFLTLKRCISSTNFVIQSWTISLISLLIACLFSYPLHVPGIWIHFILCLIVLHSSTPKKFISTSRPGVSALLLIMGISIGIFCLQGRIFMAKKKSLVAYNYLMDGDIQHSLNIYNTIKDVLAYDYTTILPYANALSQVGEFAHSNEMIAIANDLTCDGIAYLIQGNNFAGLKMFKESEESYRKAISIDPQLLYPRYVLVKFYLNQQNHEKACEEAKQIASMKVKVRSAATDQIKAEMIGVLGYCRH